MHDAEVHAANKSAVVVNEAEKVLGPIAFDYDFFEQLPTHPRKVCVSSAACVIFTNVPADPNRA